MPSRPVTPRRPGGIAPVRRWRMALALALAILTGAALTACSVLGPEPTPTPTGSTSLPAPTGGEGTATPAPTIPALVPDGTAEDNLPLFAYVVETVWGSPDQVSGRAYIDALVAVGFDKAAMQVTEDYSTVGNPAESIMFSVQWNDQCLVGQVGPATGDPVATVVPALAEGGCLIGQTRPITW